MPETVPISGKAFKAYDIRGRVPEELNEELAYRVGRAYAGLFKAKTVAVGRDIRLSGKSLSEALTAGLTDAGCNVLDIGLAGTEMIYFAAFHWKLDGGIMVTASHNPGDYNGLKLVRDRAIPVSGDSGLKEIEETVVNARFALSPRKGVIATADILPDYIEHLLTWTDRKALKPLRIVVNAGNGCAGPVIDALGKYLPYKFIKLNNTPDGTFPNGVPNPLLVENRDSTASAVLESGADAGIAWDGDFDRCFFFDERGEFVEGYYLVGLLAERALKRHPGGSIIHDPRLVWNTIEIVQEAGGVPVVSKSGHAFIKEKMRDIDAAYGGEMSAHHYFKEFSYCDSGMIPWLQVTETMSERGRPLSEMVDERIAKYPVSGEINLALPDPRRALAAVRERYEAAALGIDEIDGVSMEFSDWRFNVRMSNTEPVVRVNVETRGDSALLKVKTQEVLRTLEQAG